MTKAFACRAAAMLLAAAVVSSAFLSCGQSKEALVYSKGSIPDGYTEKTENGGGSLETFTYKTALYAAGGESAEKTATVYTPFGYDKNDSGTRYNILYLMHGAGGSDYTYMGDSASPRELKYIIDNLIENGDIEPLIVVLPSVQESEEGEFFTGMMSFRTELRQDIVPAVESEFNTYARGTDEASLEASRTHRAFGGFSMGGYLVWDTFAYDLDMFAWFLPMSCYYYSDLSDRTAESGNGAALIANAAESSGYGPDGYHIFAASGSEDFLCDETESLVQGLCDYTDCFIYTDTPFENGNISFYLGDGGEHGFRYSLEYIYNALPIFFK